MARKPTGKKPGKPRKKWTKETFARFRDLDLPQNSDWHHSLYDLFNYVEAHGGSSRLLQMIDKEIASSWGNGNSPEGKWLTAEVRRHAEIKMRSVHFPVGNERYFSVETVMDNAIRRLFLHGNGYDHTMPRAAKAKLIRVAVASSIDDLLRHVRGNAKDRDAIHQDFGDDDIDDVA